MQTLIRQGWSQFAVVASGLCGVLVALRIAFMPNVGEFYAREFLVPRIADRYGFHFWMVQVTRDGHSSESPGIVTVNPRRGVCAYGRATG